MALALYQIAKIKWKKKCLKNKLVLITGAAQGLGKELAFAFARQGANICLWDFQKEKLAETAQEMHLFFSLP